MAELPTIREVWDYNRPDESERRFRRLREQAEASGERSYALEVRTQLARALGLQGRFEEAHEVLDDVEAALTPGDRVARLRLLLERGRALNSSGHADQAMPLFLDAWRLGGSIPHHDLAVDAAHMLAIVAPMGERRGWNETAMAYAEASGDSEAMRWLGSLYNNMGWDAHDAGDYEEALRLHQKCWDWHRERRTGQGERIAKWSVAKQLRFLGRSAEAETLQRELLEEYRREEPGGEGFVHEELAELAHASGRVDEARRHFAAAHSLLADIDWIEPERLARLAELGSPTGDSDG